MNPPPPTDCMDCSNLTADVVKRYYDAGAWLLLPFAKYEPFIRWARKGVDPGMKMDHHWGTCREGVRVKKR